MSGVGPGQGDGCKEMHRTWPDAVRSYLAKVPTAGPAQSSARHCFLRRQATLMLPWSWSGWDGVGVNARKTGQATTCSP